MSRVHWIATGLVLALSLGCGPNMQVRQNCDAYRAGAIHAHQMGDAFAKGYWLGMFQGDIWCARHREEIGGPIVFEDLPQ